MDLRWKLRLAAIATACACCGVAHAQVSPPPRPAVAAPSAGEDMPMPDDLGVSLARTQTSPPSTSTQVLSVDSPIEQIAATPQGKAALERVLPGLCERPEYAMFKTMSLTRLAAMSNGRITEAKLDAVQADLGRAGPVYVQPSSHGMFYPIAHTASDSIHYGGKQIGRFSRSLYHRVVLVVASL